MKPLRPFQVLRTRPQWLRVGHAQTWVDPIVDAVALDWDDTPDPRLGIAESPAAGGGLAFDAACRLYRSAPDANRVDKIYWANPSRPQRAFLTRPPGSGAGPGLGTPRGLCVDRDDRLFVCEAAARRVLVFDLWSERVLRRVGLGATPLDAAAGPDGTVHLVCRSPASRFTMTARRGPVPVALAPSITEPSRIAVAVTGTVVILDRAGTADASIHVDREGFEPQKVPHATDIELTADPELARRGKPGEVLVVAGRPGADFRRFVITTTALSETTPLRARGYDGLGIVRTPPLADGRWAIAYFDGEQIRHAAAARLKYAKLGTVASYALDAGDYQARWGRIFLDACIPDGARVRLAFVTSDDLPEPWEPTAPRTPPSRVDLQELDALPGEPPPMAPLSRVPASPFTQALHRRIGGRELPWTEPHEAGFDTYEAPIDAAPGRYLWVFLELLGNSKVSPRVRAVRAEHPGHDLLARLPKTYSRDVHAADFLQRFFAPVEGLLQELDARAAHRHALVMARAAPAELLPWLAGFVGLVFDERWTEAQRRTFIDEVIPLFRRRGTVRSLERMLEIALGVRPRLIEHYRLRGLGGAILGAEGVGLSSARIGAFRVGGEVGGGDQTAVGGTLASAFETRAHRFSVLVPSPLTPEQVEMAHFILDWHRPAHTLYDLCTVDAGMRIGLGLHVELSSVIGRSGGFDPLQLNASALGRGTIVGRPDLGTSLGGSRIGKDTRVG